MVRCHQVPPYQLNNHMKICELIENTDGLRWASGPDIDKAVIKYRQKNPDYVVVNANIKDLFHNTWPSYALDIDDPKGGSNGIRDRIAKAKMHWSSGSHMDPSEIIINDEDGEPAVVWQDGRHRLAAAHQMGYEYGQVVLPRSDLEKLRKIVRIRD